jgi:hypothetical protein
MLVGPGDGWSSAGRVTLLILLSGLVVTGLLLRRSRPVTALLVAAGAVTVVAGMLAFRAPDAIRGVFIACPVVTVGLVAWRRSLFGREPVRMLAAVTVAFYVAVAATTYAEGGGLEWGARYLAISLPLALPLAVASVHLATTSLAQVARRAAIIPLVAISLIMAATGVRELREGHDALRSLVANIDDAAARAPGSDLGNGDRRPVVVTTMFPVGRLTLGPGPDVRGLTALSDAELADIGERLHELGVDRFVLVSEQRRDTEVLQPWFRVSHEEADGRVLVMEAT